MPKLSTDGKSRFPMICGCKFTLMAYNSKLRKDKLFSFSDFIEVTC